MPAKQLTLGTLTTSLSLAALLLLTGGCLFSSPNPVTERVSSVPTPHLAALDATPAAIPEDSSLRLLEMQQRIEEMTELLAAASARPNDQGGREGLIQALENKARKGNALAAELNALNSKTESAQENLTANLKIISAMTLSIKQLHARTNELELAISDIAGKLVPMEENLRMLRLGNYEYYTVRAGDTCKSIAAQQFVYGDETKHVLIRQANRDQVTDLDHLAPDTVLIIPRPAIAAVHEL